MYFGICICFCHSVLVVFRICTVCLCSPYIGGNKSIYLVLENKNNLTLLRDGTAKKGKHICGIELASEDHTYTVGLREVSENTAENLLNTTEKVISDLSNGNTEKIKSIIM